MSLKTQTTRKIALAAAVLAGALVFSASSGKPTDTIPTPSSNTASGSWASISGTKPTVPMVLVQATTDTTQQVDATSASTPAAEPNAPAESEVVSGASEVAEEGPKDAAYCLKCHGPFEKLAQRTKDYVTEWDEKANPHVYIPHDSKTIVDCTECHDAHAIPFKADENLRKPNVQYCYSCHHAETLVNCNKCHNE